MILKRCYLTQNRCYKNSPKITNGKPVGIIVHSTGANNKNLKRYVQPSKDDSNYDEIIADIGKNKFGNSWNRYILKKCVHAMIGVNAAGTIETYETLPYDICSYGVGKGKNGSYNYNPTAHIQFEILEDNLKNEYYFEAAFKEAIEYCAYLCEMFNLSVDTICSHKEAHAAGYGSGHGDCDHWLKKFGKNMDWFRAEVKKILEGETTEETTEETTDDITVEFVKIGSKGDSVVLLQNLLNGLGYKDGKKRALATDGVCGSNTVYAIKEFQKANGLGADGKFGVASWKSILGATSTSGNTTITVIMPLVKNNSKGSAVKALQILLNVLDYKGSNGKALSVDGICGANSVYAIKAYQKKNNLAVDGCCGANTWKSILG